MARRGKRKRESEEPEVVEEIESTTTEEIEGTVVSDIEPTNFDDYQPNIGEFFEQKDEKPEEVIIFEEEQDETDFEEVIEEVKEETAKPALNDFFEQDKKKSDKLKKKPEKEPKEKRKSKRQLKKERDYEAIKDKKIFKYKGKKYTKVEDFIKYLNDHFLDLEKISEEVLEDENFLGWVSKRSGTFAESIKTFKQIKEEIENK